VAKIMSVPIEKIKVGDYAQRLEVEDEGIEGLAASILRIGIVVPLSVCRKNGEYHLVAGHRRYVAAGRAGLAEVPCIIVDSEQEKSSEVAFAENFFRKDLSPLELASALGDCLKNKIQTADELARGFHRSTEWVRRMVAILDWPGDVLEAIHGEKVSVAAAHNLALVDDDAYRAFLVRNAVDSGATARTTAAWLQAWRSMQPMEVAVQTEPVSGRAVSIPAVPQAAFLAVGEVLRTDELSHVPIFDGCIRAIRNAGG